MSLSIESEGGAILEGLEVDVLAWVRRSVERGTLIQIDSWIEASLESKRVLKCHRRCEIGFANRKK